MNDRTEQIIASLQGLGTSPYRLYTNQEVIDHLKELQAAMARGVFEKTHAENLRDKDIMLHFKTLAEEYGLAQTDTYCRFETNMRELSYTIGTYIKGMCGERMARKSLKLLSLDKNIRILYNVQLEDEDVQAEYDAIVVAPYGLFVVEVKNWDGDITITPSGLLTKDEGKITYSLADKMSIKEALLREYLQDQFPASFHTMLLLPTEKAHVQDDYQKIFVCCGGALSYEIQSFESPENAMTAEQVVAIAETICAHHKEQRTLCPVNCDEIIEDYAILMARMLKQVLDSAKREYDYILLDCTPSLGMLTVNALAAADTTLIPMQAQYLSAKGLEQLLQTIGKVRRQINPKLKIEGILLTMTDNRTIYGQQISNLIRQGYGKHLKVFNQTIPRSIRAAEISTTGKSIYQHDPKGKVAEAYHSIAKEVVADAEKRLKRNAERDTPALFSALAMERFISPMPSTALSARFVQTIIRKKNPRRRKKIVTRFFCQSLAAISCGTRSALASARTKPT